MGYHFVLARPTGEPLGEVINAKARSLTKRLNGPHEASIVLDLNDALNGNLAPGLARLKVYRAPTAAELAASPGATRTLVFYGVLTPTGIRDSAASGETQATFTDPRWIFPQRFSLGTESYTSQDQGSILWGLVDTQNNRFAGAGDTWIRQGSITTGTTRTKAYDRQQLSALFDQMTRLIDGPDIDVAPIDGYTQTVGATAPPSRIMGQLNVYSRQGSTRSNAQFVYLEDGGGNVGNVERTYMDILTYSIVVGATDTTGVPITASYGDPTASLYGLVEEYATESDITTSTLLTQRATGPVEAFKVPRSVITIADPTPQAPIALAEYDIGDTVYVTCRKGAMVFAEAPLRVHAIQVDISQEGRESVSLTTAEV